MATKKKQPAVKKHTVRAQVQVLEFTRAGSSMELEIFANREKIGTIVIGHGSLTWRGGRRKNVKTFSWSEFARLMDDQAYE
jgi:nucleotide-binding universal stress UspA family protein